MLNRRHIRIKVMQTIYAFGRSENVDFSENEKFLTKSIEGMYNLYLLQMSLLIELQKKAEDYSIKSQKKHLATEEEKNPNKKFVNNTLLHLIKENLSLKEALKNHKIINWKLDGEYVDLIFKAIIKSDVYRDYMQTRTSNFKEDQAFIVAIFKDIIAPNDKLYNYLEDKKMTWIDDVPVVNTRLLKLLRKAKENSPSHHFLPELYKDSDDKEFAIALLKNTLLHADVFKEAISEKTKNWDTDRIARIDYVLLQMALCEFKHFPTIPVKVTINEYLEVAKEYSTPKSSIFINGILDKLVKEYQEANSLNKTGRGLM